MAQYAIRRVAASTQQTFATPEDAASALVARSRRTISGHARRAGHAGGTLSSGDPVADRATASGFVAAYDAKHAIAATAMPSSRSAPMIFRLHFRW
jgi:hypothetical protein